MKQTLALALLLTACTAPTDQPTALPPGPTAQVSAVAATAIPPAVAQVATARLPGLRITQAERKQRGGMTFYDVEGTRPDGQTVELDILQEASGYRVVEIQRDLAWSAVPANVRAATADRPSMFTPERVIESAQEDGTVIFELFAPGNPNEPAAEVQVKDGKATMLTERWRY